MIDVTQDGMLAELSATIELLVASVMLIAAELSEPAAELSEPRTLREGHCAKDTARRTLREGHCAEDLATTRNWDLRLGMIYNTGSRAQRWPSPCPPVPDAAILFNAR